MNRRTLKSPARVQGLTLFTGVESTLDILPAPAGHGITLRRTDLAACPEIPALVTRVVPENRRTVLSANPADPKAPTIQTVEHVLSALAGLGITDAKLELAGPEVPMGDGSALPFVDAIRHSGGTTNPTVSPSAPTAGSFVPAVIRTPIIIEDGPAKIEARPSSVPGLTIEYHLSYPQGSGLEPQTATLTVGDDMLVLGYRSEVAPARTFSLLPEAQAARAAGFFKHLEPKDTLVIGPSGPIDNSYRFPNEPARHKLLDVLGDLALAGRPIRGFIVATRSGHAMNHALARAISTL